jgi:regulator of protease activity HflC (stomatin/prohibitin superfamily)
MNSHNPQEKNIFAFGDKGKGIEDFFVDLIDLLFTLFDKVFGFILEFTPMLIVAFFLYTIVRVFILFKAKGWENASNGITQDFQKISGIVGNIFIGIWKGIKKFFGFFPKHKIGSLSFLGIFFVVYTVGHLELIKIMRVYPGQKAIDVSSDEVLEPGTHFFSPFFSDYILTHAANYPHSMSRITADSSELQDVVLDVDIVIKFIDDENILSFYKNNDYSMSIAKTARFLVEPKVNEELKKIIIKYSYLDVHKKQTEIKKEAIQEIKKVIHPMGLTIEDLNIKNILISRNLTNTLVAEKIAKSKTLEAETETKIAIEIANREKQKKIIEAEGIKIYNEMLKEAETSDKAIKLKELEMQKLWIEKWDGRSPTQIGGEFTPFQ